MATWLITFLICVFMLLAGVPMGAIQESPQPVAQEESGGTLVQTTLASLRVPEGWVRSEAHSTTQKNCYILRGTEGKDRPDNIAVSLGSCPYTKKETMAFGQAILQQLMRQVDTSAMVYSDGGCTDYGDALLSFTLSASNGSRTVQYYILGEKQFCLIHLTNFSGSEAADQAAEAMAASFRWSE